MRKTVYLVLFTLIAFVACKKEQKAPDLKTLTIQLVYQSSTNFKPVKGVVVKLTSKTASFEEQTDNAGKVTFTVPIDIYDASATDSRSDAGVAYVFNGLQTGITLAGNTPNGNVISLNLSESKLSQMVIKELFVGGTPKDDGSGAYAFDKYAILYNNSSIPANLGNLCLGMIAPFNSIGTNNYYGADGKLIYEAEKWIPAVQAFWYFRQNVVVEPGKQIVIALNNAVNNQAVHSKSINFDNPEYYATYDIEKFTNVTYYPTPIASIPTSHYLKAEKYGAANAWSISVNSPGFFIFEPKNTTPAAFGSDASQTHVLNVAYTSKKVPTSWIIDGVEAFVLNNTGNQKRLTADVDAGYVYHINNQGYSIYRNVDETATKAIAGNTEKLKYNYNYGTVNIGGSTDPSGIDAEASIKNGARIIYKDSNNSTNDFHLRSQASLRN